MVARIRHAFFDGSAVGLSFLCLLHCLLLPFSMAIAPAFAAFLDHNEVIHMAFFVVALPISMAGLWLGARRNGMMALPIALASVGLVVMFVGALEIFGHALGVPMTIFGVSLVGAAHIVNWRHGLKRKSTVAQPDLNTAVTEFSN